MARIIDPAILVIAAVVLVVGAPGGPGWSDTSGHAVLATHLERTAASPLHGLLASVAVYIPAGEAGFRIALLSALLGAFTIAGVARAARALFPNDPVTWLVGPVLLLLAPAFRGASGPSLLAALGVAWTVALALDHARTRSPRTALAACASAAIGVGAAPWLGLPVAVVAAIWLSRAASTDRGARTRTLLIVAGGAIGALAVLLWIGAVGRLPDPAADLTAFVAASSDGAVLVGVGLLGIAFATVTRLRGAPWLACMLAITVAHAIFLDASPAPVLAVMAVGAAVLPCAIVRVLPERRHLVAATASVPLVGVAWLAGGTLASDDPGDSPSRLATDLLDELPPGPGVFVATRATSWSAIEYAQFVAGARPDLALAPPLPPTQADALVKQALVTDRIAAADVFAFGRLDPRRAFPRGRAFQLLAAEPQQLAPIRPPARYATATGEREAILLALELGRYEAGFGRLDAAAHAAGLASTRFGAAELALLATARPSRPPLVPMLPSFGTPVGPWVLELFGDDLAWVVGIPIPEEATAPPARKLHALWRKLLTGAIKPDDPAIAAMGPEAIRATAQLLAPDEP